MSTGALRAALKRMANAADAVGVAHFDSDDLSPEVEELQRSTEEARAALAQPVSAGPVAWMRDAGEPSISTMAYCITESVRRVWLKANPKQVERYTVPLYAAPPTSAERVPLTDEAAPVATDARGMLEFLSARFKHAGVSEAVAESYARDIDAILAAEAQPARMPLTDDQIVDASAPTA